MCLLRASIAALYLTFGLRVCLFVLRLLCVSDFVPADLRIVESAECLFSTQRLTNRAELLEADPNICCNSLVDSPNMALVGYQCTAGSCVGLVVATGADCYLSKLVVANKFPPSSDHRPALALDFTRV